MVDTVPYIGSFGRSSLFDTGDGERSPGVDTIGVNQEDIHAFVSSTGETIQLRKKPGKSATENISLYTTLDTVWRSDDTYGININFLLDKINASSEDRSYAQKASTVATKVDNNTLWVEKWRPKKFLDLVGNEKINRRMLGWLRQWAPAVFKEQLPKLPSEKEQNEIEPDPLNRPQKRILLLHGPPGIGKTSVAHVIVKQSGFSVSEMNASDERAGPMVKEKIHNILFNHTFDTNPVCLIADEIDGSVESGFIRILVDIIQNDSKATNKLLYGQPNKKKDKKKTSELLIRPIICICNNLYAPALEKLKPFCEIVAVKRPSDSTLQERLNMICHKENMDVPIKTINELIDLAQGDVRNCINNLQFLASNIDQKNADSLDKSNFNKTTWASSNKDSPVSWFKIVNQLFRRDPHRDIKDQFYELLHQVELNGNLDKIMQGCFNVFPYVKYSDDGIRKPAKISDWLFFHDLMHQSMYGQNGELLRYSALVPLVFFQTFGDIANKEDIRMKNNEYEQRELQRATLDIVESVIRHISVQSPLMASFTDKKSLVFEVLPYLDSMISSDFNKVKNLKLKQTIMETLVPLLKSYQLNLIQDCSGGFDSRSVLTIDPPIDKVVLLDLKHINEVEHKRPNNFNTLLAKIEETRVKKRNIDQVTKDMLQSQEIHTKKSKTTLNSSSSTIDFFKTQYGMLKQTQESSEIQNSGESHEAGQADDSTQEAKIWVKYKEGFSNAVRKNVTWNSLWD
ncbi:ctf18p [Saccharomyces arboricola H-6]|uniref:Ctf18p n=1 Tax=Saccharomyces arboricola (strain H-6 / AS 2.3317 / CBS 10644) TaxID=1160507 RepID=J8PJS0_SACAR|nr:ctf18p [Saccharomyces arboricola H-6]